MQRDFTYKVHPILGQPVERLEEQQHREEGHEFRIEVIAEHGERQAGFGQRIPKPVHQVLELGGAQCSEKDLQSRCTKQIRKKNEIPFK